MITPADLGRRPRPAVLCRPPAAAAVVPATFVLGIRRRGTTQAWVLLDAYGAETYWGVMTCDEDQVPSDVWAQVVAAVAPRLVELAATLPVVEVVLRRPEIADGIRALGLANLTTTDHWTDSPALGRAMAAVTERLVSLVGETSGGRAVVATDASLRRRGLTCAGLAWVGAGGQFAVRTLEASRSVFAEVAAISMAVHDHAGRPLRILSDSRDALSIAGRLQAGSSPSQAWDSGCWTRADGKILERAAAVMAGTDVDLEWVRGHDGHALNEAADRLAMRARRMVEAGLGLSRGDEVLQRIVADVRAADIMATL